MKKKLKKVKYPGFFEGDGAYDSLFHVCVVGSTVRLQVNSRDTLYIEKLKDIRKLARHLNKCADYLRDDK